ERITRSNRGSSVLKENVDIKAAIRARDSVFPKERWTTDSARQAEAIYVKVVLHCVKVGIVVIRENLKLDAHGIPVCAEIGIGNAGILGRRKVIPSTEPQG